MIAVVRGGGNAVLVVPAMALIALLTFGVWVGNTAAWWVAVVVQIVVLLPFASYGPSVDDRLEPDRPHPAPAAQRSGVRVGPAARARRVDASTP